MSNPTPSQEQINAMSCIICGEHYMYCKHSTKDVELWQKAQDEIIKEWLKWLENYTYKYPEINFTDVDEMARDKILELRKRKEVKNE